MSGGILGNFFGGGEGQGTGLLGGMNNFAADNSGGMIGLGLGLMSGDMSNAATGYMQGQRQDTLRRQQKLLQDQELQKRTAAKGYAEKMGIDPRMADANPDGVLTLWQAQEQKRLVPKEQSFEEKLFAQIPEDQRPAAAMAKFGLGKSTDQPTEVREYQFDMQQRKSMGQPAVPYQEWIVAKKGNDNRVMAGDRKVIYGAEDENLNIDNTVSALKSARELSGKSYEGAGAGARAAVGSNLPDWMVPDAYADKQGATNTSEYKKLMSMEAIKTMTETLKGATTDFELGKFEEILADPSTPKAIRERTIDRMLMLAERKRGLNNSRINEISGGTYFKNRAGGGQGQGAPNATPPGGKTSSGLSWSVD